MSNRISGAAMVHLENELGPDLARVIFDPANFPKVREFAQKMFKGASFTTLTIGGRVYDSLGFLRGDEKSVRGPVMVERAKGMNAHSGQDEGEYLLKHQGDIPKELRGKVVFVFTDWRGPGDYSVHVYCVYWSEDSQCWVKKWHWLARNWSDHYRVLRPKP